MQSISFALANTPGMSTLTKLLTNSQTSSNENDQQLLTMLITSSSLRFFHIDSGHHFFLVLLLHWLLSASFADIYLTSKLVPIRMPHGFILVTLFV